MTNRAGAGVGALSDAAWRTAAACAQDGDCRVVAFFSPVTVFGTPLDATLSELAAIEAFFPADAAPAQLLRQPSSQPIDRDGHAA